MRHKNLTHRAQNLSTPTQTSDLGSPPDDNFSQCRGKSIADHANVLVGVTFTRKAFSERTSCGTNS